MQWSRLNVAQAIVLSVVAVCGVALAALWKPMGITKETVMAVFIALSVLPIGTWLMPSPLKPKADAAPPADGDAS